MAVACALLLIKPVVFVGGASDDGRYLLAARAWIAHGAVVGTLHWDLRHPLVIPVALATWVFGEGKFGLLFVPVCYSLGLLAVSFAWLRWRFGVGTAILWGALFAVNPLIHELSTRIYPDIGEAFLTCAALAGCDVAASRRGPTRLGLLIAAGVCMSLAMLMRETSYLLMLIVVAGLLTGFRLPRRDWAIVLLAVVPLIAVETIWLWSATGDALYRIHVAMHHVAVPSTHMRGRVFTDGAVLFNAELASRWIAPGPIDIHWTINPLIDFAFESFYGGIFLAASALGVVATRDRVPLPRQERLVATAVGCYAVASFVFVTYVLMLSQRPRYYLLPMMFGMLVVAVLAPRLARHRPRLVAAVLGLHILASLVIIGVRHPAAQGMPDPHLSAAMIDSFAAEQ